MFMNDGDQPMDGGSDVPTDDTMPAMPADDTDKEMGGEVGDVSTEV